jgi:monoamine oxidase
MGRALAEHGAVEIGRIERRAFMGAAMGALLGGCGSAQGKASPSTDTPRRVAVIGAGLAGLHCAYRLWQADSNMEVSVYDANTRWGGRVFTGRNLFADKTLACELGGEFIEAEHATMLSLATELGIALEDREQSLDGASHTYYANGAEISEEELLSQLSSVGPAMLSALSAADDNTQNFRLLDNTRLDEFLERNVPEAKYPQLLRLLNVAFRAEFGMETDVLSTLNLWRLFPLAATRITALSGNARRRFRAITGSHAFVDELARSLRRIVFDRRLVKVTPTSEGAYELLFSTQARAGYVERAEHVVFALPFSTLRNVDLTALGLSERKRLTIAQLSYGSAVKLVGAFNGKPWRERFGKSGDVTTDLSMQTGWDGTLGGNQGQSLLTNLFAGESGAHADRLAVEENMSATLDALELVWGSLRDDYVESSAVRMHWPSSQFAQGSASAYRPSEFGTLYKTEGTREGNLHFCGEHCSLDFKGTMEGAAETGALVAAEILRDFGIPLPSQLAPLVKMKALLPQPGYALSSSVEPGLGARRLCVQLTHTEFAAPLLSEL